MSRKSRKQSSPVPVTGGVAPAGSGMSWAVCLLLAALVFLVFGRTLGHEFINFDDNHYVCENPVIQRGFSLENGVWAFTHVHASNWHPLTTLTHMLDCQVYGLWAGGHHLTNVLLHAAGSVLLFLMLVEMTGAVWRSGFVAAVFAIHPLRVESVAWVAERKDVLSGLFFVLTLWAYVRCVRQPGGRRGWLWVLLWFVLGLLSKPMLVTVPLVLLLLDYWPLGRLQKAGDLAPLLKEKLPMLALSLLSCVATLVAQQAALRPLEQVPLVERFGNALVAYAAYIGKLAWPADLALVYPLPVTGWPVWGIAAAALLFGGVSAGVWVWKDRHPYLLVGWLWFIGMLVPVIGVVQVGVQAFADRYTYLPATGLVLGVTWAVVDATKGWRLQKAALGSLAVILTGLLGLTAFGQVSYWKDSEVLWRHVLDVTTRNSLAHNNYGLALFRRGAAAEAEVHFRQAMEISPANKEAHSNLGYALYRRGLMDEAMAHFGEALRLDPAFPEAHNNLGGLLNDQGKPAEAMVHFEAALRVNPYYPESHINLGSALFKLGRLDGALLHFEEALRLNPSSLKALNNVAALYFQQGRVREALGLLEKGLGREPSNTELQQSLAWMLISSPEASLRDGARAVRLAMQANEARGGGNPRTLYLLAAAHSEAGSFDRALEVAQLALRLARDQSDNELTDRLDHDIRLYRAGKPWRADP